MNSYLTQHLKDQIVTAELYIAKVLIAGLYLMAAATGMPAPAQTKAPAADVSIKRSVEQVQYKTIKIDGVNIFYREAGDPARPTILLLHGFPTSSFMFRDLIPKLADRFHLIAPDYPGFGQSSMPSVKEYGYNFANLTETVDKFTTAVGLTKYSLYVQDYGAPIGYRLAVRHPERVQALIIQNGNAYEFGLSEAAGFLKTYGETRDPKVTEQLLGFLRLETTKFQYQHGAHSPELISPDGWTYDQSLLDRAGNSDIQIALFADYLSNVKLYPAWHEYFRKSQPPTLVVWGKNDPFFTVKGVEEGYKADLKNIEINYYDGGHFALEEYSTDIAAKIRSFLDRKLNK